MKGTYPDLSNFDYHNDPECEALSKSGIDHLKSTPAHLKAQKTNKNPPAPPLILGGAFHTYALQPKNAKHEVVVKGSAPKKERDALYLEGKYLIDTATRDMIHSMVESIKGHETASGLIWHDDALIEHSLFWDDPAHGFRCKCRPDIMIPSLGLLVDLKSTKDAHPDKFLRDALWNFGYFRQAAWYLSGANAVQEEIYYQDFLYICVEKTPPYAVAVYRASQQRVDDARAEIRPLLAQYAECLENDDYPAYPDEVIDL